VGQLCRAGALIAGVDAVAITTIGVGLERTLATNPGSLEVDFPAPSFAGDEEVTGIH
jgi:acyl dehydratase